MSYELIICEKPNAAKRIANALADTKPIKKYYKDVPYYELTHKGKKLIVVCAVGHLYGLKQKTTSWGFPVFEVDWEPIYLVSKDSKFAKGYLNAIKKLAKEASSYTIATDYDIEGEVIGLNVLRYACNQKDGARMKFSTLTKPDILNAYENKAPSLDWGQANAGETRHYLDWFYGINYSRALTHAYKTTGSFKVLSIGRVQGPSLKIIVDREREIASFKPQKYWQIQLIGTAKEKRIEAWHIKDKFWNKDEVNKVMEILKNQDKGVVNKIEIKELKIKPVVPFDLTTLQVEAYKCFGIKPNTTLKIAQELYVNGYISYPRTSSQQLPPKIGYKKILTAISKQLRYKKLCESLLAKERLYPNNGKKTDPAHPAIFPTGLAPKVSGNFLKIYDIIVKRFLATFGDIALRESIKITIDVKEELFVAKGTRTKKEGWFSYYHPYIKLEEIELPQLKKNDMITIKKIKLHEKETQPPKRYSPASIVKELAKRNLGTKATRAEIIETLFKRGYIQGEKAIKATELGIKTIETLERFCPRILDEKLTRHFEEEMELIRANKKQKEYVLEEAKNFIVKVIEDFKKHETEIGKNLKEGHLKTQKELTTLGKCPNCDGSLVIKKGKFGKFVSCSNYPNCKIAISLPKAVKPTNKICEICSYPIVKSKGKTFCINPKCSSKDINPNQIKEIENNKVMCPKCKKGYLVVKTSLYGKFLACSNYPKCKYTERLKLS